MAKIQWEYDLVERPFCQQLERMGWTWLEGDVDVPELTERVSFREVMLKDRLAAAMRKINLRDGRPWLDDARVARAIRDLEQAAGHRLMEINQSATELGGRGRSSSGFIGNSRSRRRWLRTCASRSMSAGNRFAIWVAPTACRSLPSKTHLSGLTATGSTYGTTRASPPPIIFGLGSSLLAASG